MGILVLRQVKSEKEWAAYHAIREKVLFEERGRFGVYEKSHPDEFKVGNTPFLLTLDDRGIGTVRVDLRNASQAVVRMVAIVPEERGKGHGKQLMEHVSRFVRDQGRTRLVINAAPEALDFYRKLGFRDDVWDREELDVIHAGCVQMTKDIVDSVQPENGRNAPSPTTIREQVIQAWVRRDGRILQASLETSP